MEEMFSKYNDYYLKFKLIKDKKSTRPDMHAFLLLDELFPGNSKMVCSAGHDEIWLDVSCEDIKKLSENHIIELVRCGVRYSSDEESLCMFV